MPRTTRWKTDQQRLAYNLRQKAQRRRRQGYDYEGMLAKQLGRCGGCGDPPPAEREFHRDHNHETGADRGLLCGNCNLALGLLKDDPERILGLLRYLQSVGEYEGPLALID